MRRGVIAMRLVDVDALARYIEADWRVRKKSRTVHSPMDDAQDFTFQRCLTLIERMPTVDAIPREKWNELKETIIEMRDNDCTALTMDVCKFLTNLMEILEKEGKSDGPD